MSLSTAVSRLASASTRQRGIITQATRSFATTTVPTQTQSEKRYVRIAGPASYASSDDLRLFLGQNGVQLPNFSSSSSECSSEEHVTAPMLVQGQSDVYQNHSVWLYDAGDETRARQIASQISGKVIGLKLIRASPIDQKIVTNMVSPPTTTVRSGRQRTTLRRRMNVIAPTQDEKGRALLATNLPYNLHPRLLWSFFTAYDVLDIRVLRKSGVACIVFENQNEAYRALRERSNLMIQNKNIIGLKMHE